MKIQPYARTAGEPTSAGGAPVSGAGTAELGSARGLAVLQSATIELAQRAQEAQRTTDVMLRTQWFRQTYGEAFAQRSADAAGYTTLYRDSADLLKQAGEHALRGVTDPKTRAALQAEIFEFGAQASVVARKTQIEQQVAWSRGALEQQLFIRRQEVARVSSVEQDRLIKQTEAILQGAMASGFISPLEGEKKLREFVDGVAEDSLQLRVFTEPEAVLRDIAAGRFDRGGQEQHLRMSTASRQRIILTAERRAEALRQQRIADERRADERSKDIARENQKQNFGALYSLALSGQSGAFEAINGAFAARQINGKDYRTLLDAATAVTRAGGPGNPVMMEELRDKAYRGALIPADLLAAVGGPVGINHEEARELQTMLRQGAEVVNTRRYREAATFLDAALGVNSVMVLGRGRDTSQTNAVAGLARRELYERMLAQQNDDPMLVVQSVIESYAPQTWRNPPALRYPNAPAVMRALQDGALTPELAELELFKIRLHEMRRQRNLTP